MINLLPDRKNANLPGDARRSSDVGTLPGAPKNTYPIGLTHA
jgi:hypothetical protein